MLSELVLAFWFYPLQNGLLTNWEISISSMQVPLFPSVSFSFCYVFFNIMSRSSHIRSVPIGVEYRNCF